MASAARIITPKKELSNDFNEYSTEESEYISQMFPSNQQKLTKPSELVNLKKDENNSLPMNTKKRENAENVEEAENSDLLFFKSLLPDLATLTAVQKSSFKLCVLQKLNDLLYNSTVNNFEYHLTSETLSMQGNESNTSLEQD